MFASAFGGFYPSDKPVDEVEYIRWFTEPHDSHLGKFTIVEIGDRIVYAGGNLSRDVRLGNRTLRGFVGGIGAATHADFQGRGIFRAMERWSRDAGIYPPLSLDRRTTSTRGFRPSPVPSSGEMCVYLYVQRPWRRTSTREGRAAPHALLAAPVALWGRLRRRLGPKGSQDVTLRTLPTFDQRFGPFLERASAAWDVIPIRNLEFLNWRFCDPRAGTFTVRAAEAKGELVGYSVIHTVGARGHIVDLLALPGSLDVVRALIDDAVTQLGEAGTTAVECWMLREQPYARVLREAGFVRLPARSGEVAGEVGWYGSGIGPEERAVLASRDTRVHLVRTDFDGI